MLDIQEHVILAPYTTFKIGGPARWYVEVAHADEVKEAIQFAVKRNIRHVVLAGASNVLIPDEGLHALVIRLVEGEYTFFENGIRAEAGCNLLNLIQKAGEHGFGGWEKLAGIPGSLGGAIRGNAGAFGSEIKDYVASVAVINEKTLESRVFLNQYLSFGYRDSTFKRDNAWIITAANLELGPTRPERSAAIIAETILEREKRHLQNVQAAGSFFMNPVVRSEIVALFEKEKHEKSREGRVPAGWLIEKAGLKGAKVGGAIASEQHPNYLVNSGQATAQDVLALAQKIKQVVKAQFAVQLTEEAAIVTNV